MLRSHIASLMASSAMIAFAPPDDRKGGIGQHTTTEVDTTSDQTGFGGSISMDVDGDDVQISDTEGSHTDHIEVGEGADNAEVDGPEADAEGEGDGDDTTTSDDDGAEPPAELPEFKADDPEVVAVFDKTFRNAEGKLNMDALSTQWWGNAAAAEDGKGHLTEDTYAYLDSLGIPKDMVNQAEAGLQALNTQNTQALYSRAGGKANLDAAIAWAATGDKPAYTKAQQEAFNAAIDAGGEKAQDAIDLLMSRKDKAASRNPSPRKTAGEHASQGGAGEGAKTEVFATREEWLAARKEAGRDNNKQAAVSRKFRASPNAGKW